MPEFAFKGTSWDFAKGNLAKQTGSVQLSAIRMVVQSSLILQFGAPRHTSCKYTIE